MRGLRAKIAWGLLCLIAAGAAFLVLLDTLFPPRLDHYRDRSSAVLDRDGRLLRAFTTSGGIWRFAAHPSEVDPLYLRMLKAYEDKRFDSHMGVDPFAVARAAGQWAASGRPVSGASTLTMQVARLLEPRPRTLAAKGIEMLRALQLEWRYGKDRILAIYLTVAPFGGNLEGIKAASRFYFGKRPSLLTAGEAALLVALPQSPERNRPDRHPEKAGAARDKVLARMVSAGVLSPREARLARSEPIPSARAPAPMAAPHLARRLHLSQPGIEIHRTPIDSGLQDSIQDMAARLAERLEPGANVAVLVAENEGRGVRAYVGSAGFLESSRHGQVDMVRAVRSPGSTLKPFIYAAAFDSLFLHPETLIDDSPTRFGDYAPLNFDLRYRGEITVREALQLSLNVPAVAVLDRLGPARFARRIESSGVRFRFDPRVRAPALPMALGGVGLSLWDLVTLYSGLASGGVVKPLRVTDGGPEEPGTRLFGPAAAWYTAEVLCQAPGPERRIAARHRGQGPRFALKTGTSYGFRDAWAIGFDRNHTVGVWIGRADGAYGTGRTGGGEAAPLLFDVFDLLGPGGRELSPEPPPEGVLLAANRDLPPPMRRCRTAGAMTLALGGPGDDLEIAFPPDGTTVEIGAGSAGMPQGLGLKARGGRKPIRWLVDGRPIASAPFKRTAYLDDPGRGRVRLTAIDRDGRAASAEVWIADGPGL
ncbi:MAG: penicillin-binding protein 1C [Rhodospirillales bacterium]|nr:penicillin-binding protein 1C [Rhodospirillales bacterium]